MRASQASSVPGHLAVFAVWAVVLYLVGYAFRDATTTKTTTKSNNLVYRSHRGLEIGPRPSNHARTNAVQERSHGFEVCSQRNQ